MDWNAVLCGVSLVGSLALFVTGWKQGETLLAFVGLFPLATTLVVWKEMLRAQLVAWGQAHLPLDAMARVAQAAIRDHLVSAGTAGHGLAPVRAYWRLGRCGVHLHELRIHNMVTAAGGAHSALLPYTGRPWVARMLGGLCGQIGAIAHTDTMLGVQSAHDRLHLLHVDATILPPDGQAMGGTP